MSRHDLVPALASSSKSALTEAELVDWGTRLGRQVTPPLIITLDGELGSGKTTLAKAICAGFGVTEDVTSPTFAIVHVYEASRAPVYHLDLYRLEHQRDLQNIGWDDIMQSDALVLIEWPDRAGNLLPERHLPIQLRYAEGASEKRVLYAGGHIGHATGER